MSNRFLVRVPISTGGAFPEVLTLLERRIAARQALYSNRTSFDVVGKFPRFSDVNAVTNGRDTSRQRGKSSQSVLDSRLCAGRPSVGPGQAGMTEEG